MEIKPQEKINSVTNCDCMKGMKELADNSVDLVLTDIPYGEVNRKSNGLRNLDKGDADIETFDYEEFTKLCIQKCKGSIYIFCGTHQLGRIREIMKDSGMTTRIIVWHKSNPSPMNGQHVWLSGVEFAVYGKKKGATFNAKCRNTVLKHPCGRNKIHPTEKNLKLFKELIGVSSNEGDWVLDPCMGSGTTAVACKELIRRFIGFELSKEYYDKAIKRLVGN